MNSFNILSLFFFFIPINAQECFYCATPELKDNWHLSGIPRNDAPKDIVFTEDCLNPTALKTGKTCTDMCVEIIFPIDNSVQVIRGCFSDIIGDDKGLVKAPSAESCEYVPLSKGIVPDSLDFATAATKFCVPAADAKCNGKFTAVLAQADLDLYKCQNLPIDCISCAKYDGKGKCKRDQKDQRKSAGNYCKKLDGKLGGHDYVERDAALVAPFLGDNICFDNTSFNVVSLRSGGLNSTITRAKRDVVQQFKGSVCYCKSSLCNASYDHRATLLPIVTSLIALLSTLPLF